MSSSLITLSRMGELPVTWVEADLPGQRYRLGHLYLINLRSLNRQIQRQYRRAGFTLAFSGVQISLNDKISTKNRKFGEICNIGKPLWQARVRSVIVGLPMRDVI
jgi:hypothetical protein